MAELEMSEVVRWKPACIVRSREGDVICRWWLIIDGEEFLQGSKLIKGGLDEYDKAMAARKTIEEFVSEHFPRPF